MIHNSKSGQMQLYHSSIRSSTIITTQWEDVMMMPLGIVWLIGMDCLLRILGQDTLALATHMSGHSPFILGSVVWAVVLLHLALQRSGVCTLKPVDLCLQQRITWHYYLLKRRWYTDGYSDYAGHGPIVLFPISLHSGPTRVSVFSHLDPPEDPLAVRIFLWKPRKLLQTPAVILLDVFR